MCWRACPSVTHFDASSRVPPSQSPEVPRGLGRLLPTSLPQSLHPSPPSHPFPPSHPLSALPPSFPCSPPPHAQQWDTRCVLPSSLSLSSSQSLPCIPSRLSCTRYSIAQYNTVQQSIAGYIII